MTHIFILNEFIYRPIFNLLILLLHSFSWNLWISIIVLTLLVRSLLIKQTMAWANMQQWMWDMQPKLQEIQEKYKDDPKKLSQETMKVLKKQWKWPLKWCMMMVIQIPVFLWLFYVIKNYATWKIDPQSIYSFFYSFGQNFLDIKNVNTSLFWLDLLSKNVLWVSILASVFTYLQMKITTLVKPKTPAKLPWWKNQPMPDMSKMMWFMWVFMAFMIWTFVYSVESGIWIYILTTTIFSFVQYSIQYRVLLKAKLQLLFKWKNSPTIVSKPE